MLTRSLFWFSLWVTVCVISAKLFSSHLFHIEENKVLVSTSTTRDVKQRSLLSCAYLCMATTGCCAASFASNSTCRIEMSETCNFTMLLSVGDTSILHKSGSTLKDDLIGTNSPSNQTVVFGQDVTTHKWSFISSETTNNKSFKTIQFSENIPTDALSQHPVTTDTSPTGETSRGHVITDISPTDATSRGHVTTDISSSRGHDTTETSPTEAASHGYGTTDTSPTDATSRGYGSTDTLPTDATFRGHNTTYAVTTDTSLLETLTKKYHTTEPESVSSSSQPDTTANVNSWPGVSNYIFVNIESTMLEAKNVCNSYGGKLLEINNVTKEKYLKENNILTVAAMSFFWIGAYDANGDGNYEWLSNPTVPMTYTTWNIQEPKKTGTNLCLISSNNWNLKWGSSLCTDFYPFFCEKVS